MAAGLTQWAWRDPDTGGILDTTAQRARFDGNEGWHVLDGETLTERGRRP